MASFLLKTEPGEYSFADLIREKRCVWSGVTNNTALIHLRTIRKGDDILIYHTGDERALAGLARAASDPYQDPSHPGLNTKGEPKLAVIDLVPVRAAQPPVTLAAIKADTRFAGFLLVTQGRLSVMPVPPALDRALRQLAGL